MSKAPKGVRWSEEEMQKVLQYALHAPTLKPAEVQKASFPNRTPAAVGMKLRHARESLVHAGNIPPPPPPPFALPLLVLPAPPPIPSALALPTLKSMYSFVCELGLTYIIVNELIAKLGGSGPAAAPPTTPSNPLPLNLYDFLADNDDEEEELDEEVVSNNNENSNKKMKAMWGEHSVVMTSNECSMMWTVTRPETSTMYIIIKCFKGVKLTFTQDLHTTVSVKCVISFNNDELAVLSQYCDTTFAQIKHDLPSKEITTIIDVQRTILSLREKSD